MNSPVRERRRPDENVPPVAVVVGADEQQEARPELLRYKKMKRVVMETKFNPSETQASHTQSKGSDSSSSDSDFSFKDSGDEDDDIFMKFVDNDVDDDLMHIVGEEMKDDIGMDVVLSDDLEWSQSGSDSDSRRKPQYPEFNPQVDSKKPIVLKSGMVFGSNDIFRKALSQYNIENGGDYYYLHNDKSKVSVYCKYKCECGIQHSRKKCVCKRTLCDFKACGRKMGPDGSFQLKSFNPEHTCGWQRKNHKVTSAWLARIYLENYRDDPHWRLRAFKKAVLRDYKVEISTSQSCRARLRAYLMCQGDAKSQYGKVWNYAATIMKWNPGSSAYVKVSSPQKPIFQRLYVCLDACKKGFLDGCRPILGLDGCHLKGAYTGQILTAVGKDGNENIFPVAYAVVEVERKETWVWFLENLVKDLGYASITLMSDRQKGLIEALNLVVPMAETKVCVRHLYNNFIVKWPGKAYKDALWAAARATTRVDFDEAMNFIKEADEGAFSYLMRVDPGTWSIHAFKHSSKSDMLLNNVCETFNSYILEAREFPILTMCEWIRRKLMNIFVSKNEGMKNSVSLLTPKAWKRLESAKRDSLYSCRAHWAGGDKFEVDQMDRRYVVDLTSRSCGCFKWQLTGIPCPHAIACIMMRRLQIDAFVDNYYRKETYLKAYGQIIEPLPGPKEWEKSGMIPPGPPEFIVQLGRPRKARRRQAGEKAPKKKQRHRVGKNKCSRGGVEGHRKPNCTNPSKAPESLKTKNVGGRPKDPNTLHVTSQFRKIKQKEACQAHVPTNFPHLRLSDSPSQSTVGKHVLTTQSQASNVGS